MSKLFQRLFGAPQLVVTAPVWRLAPGKDDEWCGYAAGRFGFKIFTIQRREFVETGVTYLLDCCFSDVTRGYPTLEEAQAYAKERWEVLVTNSVEVR